MQPSNPYQNAPKPPTTGRYTPKRLPDAPTYSLAQETAKNHPQIPRVTNAKQRQAESIPGTNGASAYWLATGVSSIGMSGWELLNFWDLIADYNLSPVYIEPLLYGIILLASMASLVLGIAVLARYKRPSKRLATSVAWLAALGLILFLFASGTGYSGWGMLYFLESSCVIVPVLIFATIVMRRIKHSSPPSLTQLTNTAGFATQKRKVPLSKNRVKDGPF